VLNTEHFDFREKEKILENLGKDFTELASFDIVQLEVSSFLGFQESEYQRVPEKWRQQSKDGTQSNPSKLSKSKSSGKEKVHCEESENSESFARSSKYWREEEKRSKSLPVQNSKSGKL